MAVQTTVMSSPSMQTWSTEEEQQFSQALEKSQKWQEIFDESVYHIVRTPQFENRFPEISSLVKRVVTLSILPKENNSILLIDASKLEAHLKKLSTLESIVCLATKFLIRPESKNACSNHPLAFGLRFLASYLEKENDQRARDFIECNYENILKWMEEQVRLERKYTLATEENEKFSAALEIINSTLAEVRLPIKLRALYTVSRYSQEVSGFVKMRLLKECRKICKERVLSDI